MNIYDALNEYKQYLLIEKKVSDNTLKNYMRDLEHFINYIQKQNQVVLINQIDKDMIRKYLQQFTSLAASSLSRKMVSLRSFYKFLMKEEIVEKNLMETYARSIGKLGVRYCQGTGGLRSESLPDRQTGSFGCRSGNMIMIQRQKKREV